MKAAYYLDIGDVVTFAYGGEILMPIRIMDIQHTQGGGQNPRRATYIMGQEVKPLPRVSFGTVSVSDKTFTQYSSITAFTLPPAENHKDSYVYRLEGLPTGGTFDPQTREVSGVPIHVQSALPVRYIVTDADNPTWPDEVSFNITVIGGPLAWVGDSQPDVFIPLNTDSTVFLTSAKGGVDPKTYALSGTLPGTVAFHAGTRSLVGNPGTTFSENTQTYTVTD